MTAPTGSYRDVFYNLRPAKQVERRMIIDTLLRLSGGGFDILNYQYTGLGSIYFVDFILFHKLIGIRTLVSVEHDTRIEKRIGFNNPFAQVSIRMGSIGDAIPDLDRQGLHLLWLDYDSQINSDIAGDVVLASYSLPPGSLLLVTVDVTPPAGRDGPAEWLEYFRDEAGAYFEAGWTAEAFALSALPSINLRLLTNAIKNGIAGRADIQFLQLFKFLYADGHPMVTLGGMIATDQESDKIKGCDFTDFSFLRVGEDDSPFEIAVPRLTRKERIYLDSHMPSPDGWQPSEFELSVKEVEDYRSIYRYYPIYAELMT